MVIVFIVNTFKKNYLFLRFTYISRLIFLMILLKLKDVKHWFKSEWTSIKQLPLKRKMKKKVISKAKEVLNNSISQAIIRIIHTPYVGLKIFLIVFIITSSSLTSYLVIQSITSYLYYKVITTSRTIFESTSPFPRVTFCKINKFTTKYAFELIQNKTRN